jgi:hypothetical protein
MEEGVDGCHENVSTAGSSHLAISFNGLLSAIMPPNFL